MAYTVIGKWQYCKDIKFQNMNAIVTIFLFFLRGLLRRYDSIQCRHLDGGADVLQESGAHDQAAGSGRGCHSVSVARIEANSLPLPQGEYAPE